MRGEWFFPKGQVSPPRKGFSPESLVYSFSLGSWFTLSVLVVVVYNWPSGTYLRGCLVSRMMCGGKVILKSHIFDSTTESLSYLCSLLRSFYGTCVHGSSGWASVLESPGGS